MAAYEIEIGKRYRFDYPAAFVSLPDYTAHAGQTVTVRRYLNNDEADDADNLMFKVQADDGWIGDAYGEELEEIEPDEPPSDLMATEGPWSGGFAPNH